MVTRVIDEHGNVLHDCRESGCDVSWDGYALRDLTAAELVPEGVALPANAQNVAIGKRVPGARDPDTGNWKVTGQVAKLNASS